ncbi:MAG TPA: hypothetical protein VFR58_07705 [Flavisolibacter sp.]|nr:hypothetical protein [Flavisolibacter sp.]
MIQEKAEKERGSQPATDTGHASNPNPRDMDMEPSGGSGLLDEKADKYIREVASIEDLPDANDQQEMEETIKKEEGKGQ